VPNSLIAECGRDIPGGEVAALRSEPTLIRDATTERLGWALIGADQIGGSFARVYADALSTAIVARLLSATLRSHSTKRPSGSGLPKWRLKRAIDYIEAHLAETVSLADIASSTGLTRMHFAAQFKAATGLRPHEYLLRRRIERAQEMLVGDGMPVVDVALSVGFQTQSHFTTVFTRFVGQPPQAWRHSHA
jgi:AraC-like DNA-binding protein